MILSLFPYLIADLACFLLLLILNDFKTLLWISSIEKIEDIVGNEHLQLLCSNWADFTNVKSYRKFRMTFKNCICFVTFREHFLKSPCVPWIFSDNPFWAHWCTYSNVVFKRNWLNFAFANDRSLRYPLFLTWEVNLCLLNTTRNQNKKLNQLLYTFFIQMNIQLSLSNNA